MKYSQVVTFWFDEIEHDQWWKKSREFDELIYDRFAELLNKAKRGELSVWRCETLGRLAEIIVLDQFSRNIFRDTAAAFAADGMALILAQEVVSGGCDHKMSPDEKAFAYMPYMHSESLEIHMQAEKLFQQPGLENTYQFELKHRKIIERFGRYPHRNKILGRTSTDEELAFLKTPSSSF